jgi:hypothetical protein
MAIIISKHGKNAKKVEKSSFEKEDYLQKYIYDNPESIPLYDIKEDIRLLIISREFSTNSGPIDALGIDKDGEIYLIETKLYKNPDKRLVMAQVLDYGASLWRSYGHFNEFIKTVEESVRRNFGVSFGQKLKDFFGLEDSDVDALLDSLKRNLDEGNFKFVVLMDKLHSQLKNLIVFVNQNSRFDIFAVELEYYKHEEYEIMIPKLFGAEVKKDIEVSSSGTRRKWDETSFFEDAQKEKKLSDKKLEAVKKLYDFSKSFAETTWGTGLKTGSFNVKFDKISSGQSLYTVQSDGKLTVNFAGLKGNGTIEKYRDNFKAELEKIPGIIIPQNYKDIYQGLSIDEWAPIMDEFILIVKNLVR